MSLINIEQHFSIDRLKGAFSNLGRAILGQNSSIENYNQTLETIAALTRLQAQSSDQGIKKLVQKDDLSALSQKMSELAGVTGLVQKGMVWDSSVDRGIELAKIHRDMLDVNSAATAGVISLKEGEEQLAKLQHAFDRANLHGMLGGQAEGSKAKTSLEADSKWLQGVKGAGAEAGELASRAGEAVSGSMGVSEGISELIGKIPYVGSLFLLLQFGVTEKDRTTKEFAQLENIVISGGNKAGSTGAAWLAGWEEKAKIFYGMSKGAINGVLKKFVETGISTDEIFHQQKGNLGEVGTNAVTVTLGLDTLFKMGEGSNANMASKLVSQFGYSLSDSVGILTKMEFQAQKTGVGISTFTNWSIGAAQQVRHLGVGAEEVAAGAISLLESMRKKGMHVGATWDYQGLDQALGGLSGMSLGRQIWMANKLGYGTGLAATQAMRDTASTGKYGNFVKMAAIWRAEAVKAQGSQGEYQANFWLENQGFGQQGAHSIMELGKLEAKGLSFGSLSPSDQAALSKAFEQKTEEQGTFATSLKAMLSGFAKVGQGILEIITNALALMVVGARAIPLLMDGTADQKDQAWKQIQKTMSGVTLGAEHAWEGTQQATVAGADSLRSPLEPVLKALGIDTTKKSLASKYDIDTSGGVGQTHLKQLDSDITAPLRDIQKGTAKDYNTGSIWKDLQNVGESLKKGGFHNPFAPATSHLAPTAPGSTSSPDGPHASSSPNLKVIWKPGAQQADQVNVEIHVAYT